MLGRRTLPLSAELVERLRAPYAGAEDLVFRNGRGQPIKLDNLRNRVLKPAARRAGLEGIGLHTLRHT
jgi:integrase